jgi:hypothetical protein
MEVEHEVVEGVHAQLMEEAGEAVAGSVIMAKEKEKLLLVKQELEILKNTLKE